ncbi:MAG: hypothetical protein K2K04_00420 [Clostridia bacterium]|nr:hypothetical protein [Clostridia bacterium]
MFYAGKWFPGGALFTFSLLVPITLTVMIRWGWPSVLYAMASGLLLCLLSLPYGVSGAQYASYIIGNAFIAIMLIPMHFIGKDKIRSRWWGSALFAAGGWLSVYLGRSMVWAIAYAISPVSGFSAVSGFYSYFRSDVLSLAMSVVVILVLRRLDGMFEDQNSFLKRIDKERRDRMRRDTFGDEPVEIDEESLDILSRGNDLYD